MKMPSRSQIRVLCIEDEANLRINLSDIIRSEGYTVRDFSDGVEALEFLQNVTDNIPSLVIADINMPQMNGLEFVRRMKSMGDKYNAIPVMMLTAMAHAQYRVKAEILSVQEYLVKPVDYDLLLAKVEEHTKAAD